MSVTDSYTQSQTRLHHSVTALDTATAHWRRNAANAHLAAKQVSWFGVAVRASPMVRLALHYYNQSSMGLHRDQVRVLRRKVALEIH